MREKAKKPKRVEREHCKLPDAIKFKTLLSHLSIGKVAWLVGVGGGICLLYMLFSPFSLYYKLGLVISVGVFISILWVNVSHLHPQFLDEKYLVLSSILLLSTVLISRVIMFVPQLPYVFMPFAFLTILLSLFFNLSFSVLSLSTLGIMFALVSGQFEVLPVWFCGGMVGAYGADKIHQRADITKLGLEIGLVNLCVAAGVGLIKGLPSAQLLPWVSWAVGNGIFSSLLVSVSLPYFETYFGITTDIRLVELADLNHSLLHRLSLEAPGTFHHTTTVASLAVAAAKSIGANPLLARAGAYYHDIGKVTRPHFFFENNRGRVPQEKKDYHSRVSPHLSSVIIISHVKDGAELARIFRLPQVVIDIITQHHGTSLIAYFYRKALLGKKGDSVQESNFRYPGPKPQTKEAAIVMLADSVEADGRYFPWRSIKNTKSRVEKVINNKLKDHQLDEVDLNLRELNLIVEAFTRVLAGLTHTRRRYPEEMLKDEKKSTKSQQYV